jgi:hypothetical protein
VFHPLVTDLSGLTDEELSAKITELSSKISAAYRMGSSALQQMQLIMGHYQEEYQRRASAKLAELEKNSASFKKIIDIK